MEILKFKCNDCGYEFEEQTPFKFLPCPECSGNAFQQFPYICPEHPNAQIEHEWEEEHFVLNGFPAGTGIKKNHHFYCHECHRELAGE